MTKQPIHGWGLDGYSAGRTISGINRRLALHRLAVIGTTGLFAATGIPSNVLASVTEVRASRKSLSVEQWRELIGQNFQVSPWQHGDTHIAQVNDLTLQEVGEYSWVAKRDPFRVSDLWPPLSLLFSARQDVASATYVFSHWKIGRYVFFLHPIPRDNRKNQKIYEVVLN